MASAPKAELNNCPSLSFGREPGVSLTGTERGIPGPVTDDHAPPVFKPCKGWSGAQESPGLHPWQPAHLLEFGSLILPAPFNRYISRRCQGRSERPPLPQLEIPGRPYMLLEQGEQGSGELG